MTYHSFKDAGSQFELISQSTEDGTPIEGSPNLLPQHQVGSINVAARVVEPGVPQLSMEEKQAMKDRLTAQYSKGIVEVPAPVEEQPEPKAEPKKRGPKPKLQEA